MRTWFGARGRCVGLPRLVAIQPDNTVGGGTNMKLRD